jgi:hypothetical protein
MGLWIHPFFVFGLGGLWANHALVVWVNIRCFGGCFWRFRLTATYFFTSARNAGPVKK